jgi:hypothetical protein
MRIHSRNGLELPKHPNILGGSALVKGDLQTAALGGSCRMQAHRALSLIITTKLPAR